MKKNKYIMHVLTGTHWDREWRFTAEQSKVRLVDLIDNLIKILENKKEFLCFHLDGGMVVLEDYLSIRPEMESRIKNLIKKKKLIVFPWYTLPDMFIVNGESIVRNLLEGVRLAEKYGKYSKSGYTATSYGQISQMPQIYNGFGIKTMFFYRGLNKYMPAVFLWEGKDGSKLRVYRCFDIVTRTNFFFFVHTVLVLNKKPLEGHYHFNIEEKPVHMADIEFSLSGFKTLIEDYSFRDDEETLKQALNYITEVCMSQPVGRHLLALNMEDNQKPYPYLPEMIKKLNSVAKDVYIKQSSVDNFVKETERDVDFKNLEVLRGEMRNTAVEKGFNGLLGAVLSSRINLKILNEKAETMLIYYAEPLSVFASLLGKEYPVNLLKTAWRYLLSNHAHDSICGSAIDQAHKDMLYRFSCATEIAKEITRRAQEYIWSKINLNNVGEKDIVLTVFNTLPFDRDEVVEAVIHIPVDFKITHFDIYTVDGEKIKYIKLSEEKVRVNVEKELDTNPSFGSLKVRILFNVKVRQFGYSTYIIKLREPEYIKFPEPVLNYVKIADEQGILENEFLWVKINCDGTLDIEDKVNGCKYTSMHYFTDSGEVGSSYDTREPLRNTLVISRGGKARIELIESNEIRGKFRVSLVMEIPAGATRDGEDRLKQKVELNISYTVTLEKSSPTIKFHTVIENKANDHKLSINFPLPDKMGEYSYAESAYSIEKRYSVWKDSKDNVEPYFPYMPMQNFIDINDTKKGFAFLSKGLREYRIMDNKNRTLSVTLLRTTRMYMQMIEPLTPEELEKMSGPQMPGVHEYNYALYFHRYIPEETDVIKEAYIYKVPFTILQGVRNNGVLSPNDSFFKIKIPDKNLCVVMSAMKLSENGDGFILRLFNPLEKDFIIFIETMYEFRNICELSLDEKRIIRKFKSNKKSIKVYIKKGKILTVLFRK